MRRCSGSNGSSREFILAIELIQAHVSLAPGLILAMAWEAVLGKDGLDIPLERNALLTDKGQRQSDGPGDHQRGPEALGY
jgi:hypothetical protein